MTALFIFLALVVAVGYAIYSVAFKKPAPTAPEYIPEFTDEQRERVWGNIEQQLASQLQQEDKLPVHVQNNCDAVVETRAEDAESKRARLYDEHVAELDERKAKYNAYMREYMRKRRQEEKRKRKQAAYSRKHYYKNREVILQRRLEKRQAAQVATLAVADPLPVDTSSGYTRQQVKQVALAIAAKLAPRTPQEAYSVDFGAVDAPGSLRTA